MNSTDALRDLAVRYASAVDRRDSEALADVFWSDAVVTVVPSPDSSRPETRMEGWAEIRSLPEQVAAFRRTFHMLGQSHYDLDGSVATGEVYCIAHHLGKDYDYVMYIRYQDRYRQAGEGWTDGHSAEQPWRIENRRVLVDWTERRPLR